MKHREPGQYVDQFRKLSIIEKLPPLTDDISEIWREKKQEVTVVRYRMEPQLLNSQAKKKQDVFVNNSLLDDYTKNSQSKFVQHFSKAVISHRQMTERTCQWSNKINAQIKAPKAFKIENTLVSPPSALNLRQQSKQGSNKGTSLLEARKDLKKNQQQQKKQAFPIELEDKENELSQISQENEQALISQELARLFNIRTLDEIMTISEIDLDLKHFQYPLRDFVPQTKQKQKFLEAELIHNSVKRSQLYIVPQYLRDIGRPARALDDYILKRILFEQTSKKGKMSELNQQLQTYKIEQEVQHFLLPSEISIDKRCIQLQDVSNICMRRITSTNAEVFLLRNSVTRAQYEKALKKLEKYKGLHQQTEVEVVHTGTMTTKQKKLDDKSANIVPNIHQLVEETLKLLQEARELVEQMKGNNKYFNIEKFNFEVVKKIGDLLAKVYAILAEDCKLNYSLSELPFHVEELQHFSLPSYDPRKIVWFILTTLQEMNSLKTKHDVVSSLLERKGNQVTTTVYRNNKAVKAGPISTNKVWDQTHKKTLSPALNRSASPYTPQKSAKNVNQIPSTSLKTATVNQTTQKR